MKKIILIATIVGLATTSCLKDKTIEPVVSECAETVLFETELLIPVFNMSCGVMGCHDNASAAAGLILETHGQISDESDRIQIAINHDPGAAPMPLGSPKLADSLIQKFECWIEQGKLDN